MVNNLKYSWPCLQTSHIKQQRFECFATLLSVSWNGSEWDLFHPHPVSGVHVPAVSSPAGCDVLRAPALEKTEKENFTEMAEGTTTLKGLRAQMGKKTLGRRVGFPPARVWHGSNHFVMFAGSCRRSPGFLNVLQRGQLFLASNVSSLFGYLLTMDAEKSATSSRIKRYKSDWILPC